MFSPLNEVVGDVTDLWEPISRHPLILALAIKKIIADSVFTSAAELRKAMIKVQRKIESRARTLKYLLDLTSRADEIVWTFDRPAWEAAYGSVGVRVPLAMMVHRREHKGDARWLALNELWEAKLAAECEADTEPARAAACERKSAKRSSRKLKKRPEPGADAVTEAEL